MNNSHKLHYTPKSGWFPCKAQKQCPKDPFTQNLLVFKEAEKLPLSEIEEYLHHVAMQSDELAHKMIDRNGTYGEYYAQTEAKHFAQNNLPGSKFNVFSKLEEPLRTVIFAHNGELSNLSSDFEDDREKLVALGSDPAAFLPPDKFRYFFIDAGGTVGIKNTADLKPTDFVQVQRTKTLAPCNIVVNVSHQEKTDYGVLILQQDEHKELAFITSYPGPVTKAASPGKDGTHPLDAYEDQKITVSKMREILGKDIWANTKIIS
jgi:hypothetical protein